MNLKQHIQHPIFSIVSQAADELAYESYVIGGFVRDVILERTQPTDIDFVCVGSGIELANKVSELVGNNTKVQVFKNFGTAMLRYQDLELEFVGARKESYRSDSRKPIVEDGTLEDDQNRRDFTINALAIRLNKEHFGELIDPFHGLKDLENKIIRTPLEPNITYSDDPLRMMRAIRFSSELNFSIDKESYLSIVKVSNSEILNVIGLSLSFN